jgi:hypothetical protein
MDGTTARGCSSSRPRPRPPPSTSPKAPPFHVCAVTLRLIYPGPRRWGFYCLPTACAEDTFGLYRAQPRPRLYVHRARNIAAASRLARTGALATPPWHQHTSTRASARHHAAPTAVIVSQVLASLRLPERSGSRDHAAPFLGGQTSMPTSPEDSNHYQQAAPCSSTAWLPLFCVAGVAMPLGHLLAVGSPGALQQAPPPPLQGQTFETPLAPILTLTTSFLNLSFIHNPYMIFIYSMPVPCLRRQSV